jgi:hypothetical protein
LNISACGSHRGPVSAGNPSPQEAVAAGPTVGTGSPWRRSPDLKDLILLHGRLPEPRGQDLVHVGEFVEGSLQERALRCEQSILHTMLRCMPLLRRGHWIQRYTMTAMLKKNVRPSATVTSCMEHLSSASVSG